MNEDPIQAARRRISILGSTGSIGRSALEVVRSYPELFEVAGLAAHSNVDALAAQVREFRPSYVAMADEAAGARLKTLLPEVTVWTGPAGVEAVASLGVDTALCAMVGAVGLRPLLAAIDAGNRVAVANKEPFVMAGRLVMERAAQRGVEVLPVDSEHNAIFQCLHGHAKADVRCIHLTASGGPFYGRDRNSLSGVTPEQAAKHPTWKMGRKISVDSATLMNKGLEIIEAMWLFGIPEDRIEVLIHPQSVVHSLVEFTDGSILAHLGVTDMKFPILFALTYPNRVQSPMGRLDLTALRDLSFAAPDFREFPCLAMAREAAARGGTAPAVLNAANEAAVEAFCERRISFLQISGVVGETRERCPVSRDYDLASVMGADHAARAIAGEVIARIEE
jgi:1-deoxy-D-xylulose-5-phosphate reductoisomerase